MWFVSCSKVVVHDKKNGALNSLINAWQNSTSVFIYITFQRSIDITADELGSLPLPIDFPPYNRLLKA